MQQTQKTLSSNIFSIFAKLKFRGFEIVEQCSSDSGRDKTPTC